MIWRITTAIVLSAALVLMTGCGRKTVYPDSPAMGTGTTDSNGIATMDLGPFTINITVQNEYEQPLSGMSARAYLLKQYLLAVASSPAGTYYSGLTMMTYDDAQARSKPAVPSAPAGGSTTESAASREINITITVSSAGLSAHGFDTPEPDLDALAGDDWVTPSALDYDMAGFYSQSGLVDYSGGTFVHLTPAVSSSIGAGRQTAVFLIDQIGDAPTFGTLMSLQLRVFDGDTIHAKTMAFMEGTLPVLEIDDIGMNRHFLVQFTLTWGQNPSDLDSHIWTPMIEGYTHHVYYANRGVATSAPYVDLDVDDVTSYGPEHITVWTPYTGAYTYAVYHYGGSGDITTSEAMVDVLHPDGSVQQFSVPSGSAGSNWWWHVCTVDGDSGVITPINTLSANPPLPAGIPPMPSKANVN